MNSLCKELAKTAARLKEQDIVEHDTQHKDLKKTTDRIDYLKAYAEGEKEGSGGKSSNKAASNAKKLYQSNQIKYKISLTHELCYLPQNIVEMALPYVWNGQGKNSNFKEIFPNFQTLYLAPECELRGRSFTGMGVEHDSGH